jgi:hypothetical protein
MLMDSTIEKRKELKGRAFILLSCSVRVLPFFSLYVNLESGYCLSAFSKQKEGERKRGAVAGAGAGAASFCVCVCVRCWCLLSLTFVRV